MNTPQLGEICGQPRTQAEQNLATARQAGDSRRESAALIDLGVVNLQAGDYQRALVHLERASELARQNEDPSLENDALMNLALALLANDQAEHARDILEHQIAEARKRGDRYQEKTALDNLGAVHVKKNEHALAIAVYVKAFALAQEVDDWHHQADLLWIVAIQHAELGERQQTLAVARKAIDLYVKIGAPHSPDFLNSLQTYIQGGDTGILYGNEEARSWPRPHGYYTGPDRCQTQKSGPGILWMALAASKSMTNFLGSGFKTVAAHTRQSRLQICESCHYHTGVRCKLCGCFTSVKAWLPHEGCPIGKWLDK